jgi:hypothetical protein
MLCNNKELAFLGSGFPLYFEFVKSSSLILLILFIISGLYDIVSNGLYGNACINLSELELLPED